MEEAETYRHQGFVVIKALFSHAEIDELTKIVDRIHRQWLNENQANYVEQPNNLALHVRIPLLPETGIELIPGTHHRWDTEQEKNVRLELIGHKNSEALPDSVLIALKPGDILIFDAQMLHRGHYRLNKPRKALDLCLGKPHPFTLPFLDASNLPSPAELECIENKQWYKVAWRVVAQPRLTQAYIGNRHESATS